MKKSTTVTVEDLLTKDEKIDKLIELFDTHKSEVGRLMLPDETLYKLADDGTVDIMHCGKSIQDWLGIKSHIHYTYSAEQVDTSYDIIHGKRTISITDTYTSDPTRVCALLTHELIHFLLQEKYKYKLEDSAQNEEFIDLASIYAGLGVVVLNGLGFHDGVIKNIRAKRKQQQITLGYYSDKEYAQELLGYAHRYNLSTESFAQYLMPWVKTFAPRPITSAQKDKLEQSEPVKQAHARINSQNLKNAMIALALVVLLGSIAFAIINKPKSLSKAESEQYDKVQLLRRMYEVCRQAQKDQQDTLDTSNFFLQRSVDATATRCDSIRNQYNYEVNDFNEKLNKK